MFSVVRLVGSLAIALLLVLQPAAGMARAAASASAPAAEAQPDGGDPAWPPKAASIGLERGLGQLPLYFVRNQGQMDPQVTYYVQGSDKTLYFTPQGVTLALSGEALTPGPSPRDPLGEGGREAVRSEPRPALLASSEERPWSAAVLDDALSRPRDEAPARRRWVVKLDFLGANPDVRPEGLERTEATISYFVGRPDEWHTGLPTYSRIVYRELWPGIDLVYYGGASSGAVNRLKYEFVARPGADPAQIRLAYRGASAVWLDEAGQLQVSTPLGAFSDEAPLAYQEGEGGQTLGVTVAYAAPEEQGGAYSYAFQVGAYDRSKPLVLDPAVLLYCGYIGGWASEGGSGIAVDGEGNAYVTGATNSSENTFPVAVGPDMSYNDEGYSDAFVAKVNAAGTALVYCGYIGGSGNDSGRGLAVDGEGNAYITGETGSSEDTFPVTVGPDLSYNGGGDYGDAFVAKVDATGTALDYCGYIGGSGSDRALDIAVDGAGNAYITGGTASTEATFPVTVGPDLSYHGGDAFVAKVNAAGTALLYCGYIGGSDGDVGSGIAVDAAGNAYVTGITSSSEATFPVTVGPDLSFNEGRYHAFVGKVNAAGTALDYCGYIGGSGDDFGHGIAVDGAGNAYVTGYTYSSQATFPVAVGPDLSHNGYEDAFVAKVDATGAALDYCGYIGGSASDVGLGIAVDGEGNAYVTGRARSSEATFPVTVGPDLSHNGYEDAFVAKVDATGTVLLYCGYIGGSDVDGDEGSDIAVDEEGNAYVTGYTFSNQATFPVTVGPDLSFNGYNDAFVAKVSPVSVAVHVPLLLRPSSPTQ